MLLVCRLIIVSLLGMKHKESTFDLSLVDKLGVITLIVRD